MFLITVCIVGGDVSVYEFFDLGMAEVWVVVFHFGYIFLF